MLEGLDAAILSAQANVVKNFNPFLADDLFQEAGEEAYALAFRYTESEINFFGDKYLESAFGAGAADLVLQKTIMD